MSVLGVEEWRQVPGLASHYEVSNLGGWRCQAHTDRRGYRRQARLLSARDCYVHTADGIRKRVPMAVRVLLAFVGPRPDGCCLSRHLNDDHNDNRVENLAWGTHQDNHDDAVRNGINIAHTPETRAKMSVSHRGLRHTPETRAKMSVSWQGRTFTPEHRAKLSAAACGRKFSREACAKMSAAKCGKKHTPETRAKMSAAHRGKKFTPEHRAKLSIAARKRRQREQNNKAHTV